MTAQSYREPDLRAENAKLRERVAELEGHKRWRPTWIGQLYAALSLGYLVLGALHVVSAQWVRVAECGVLCAFFWLTSHAHRREVSSKTERYTDGWWEGRLSRRPKPPSRMPPTQPKWPGEPITSSRPVGLHALIEAERSLRHAAYQAGVDDETRDAMLDHIDACMREAEARL